MKVVLLAALPNPLHGMSSVNVKVLEQLGQNSAVSSINLVPSKLARLYPGVLWQLVRLLYTVTILPFFLYKSVRSKDGILYFSISGGTGQWLELPFMYIAGLFYKKIYIHHHSFAYCNQFSTSMDMFTKIAKSKQKHVVLCKRMGELLSKHYGVDESQIIVLSNLAFFNRDSDTKPQQNRTFRIGFLSNITYDKGISEFLETYDILLDKKLSIEALIAGPCHEDGVKELIENKIAAQKNVRYLGPVYGEQKEAFFRDIDVLLFPSKYVNEAQPLTIYEAHSYAVPVIAWDRGCISSMLSDVGGLIGSGETFSLRAAQLIESWLSNEALYYEVSRLAQKKYELEREAAKLSLQQIKNQITAA